MVFVLSARSFGFNATASFQASVNGSKMISENLSAGENFTSQTQQADADCKTKYNRVCYCVSYNIMDCMVKGEVQAHQRNARDIDCYYGSAD